MADRHSVMKVHREDGATLFGLYRKGCQSGRPVEIAMSLMPAGSTDLATLFDVPAWDGREKPQELREIGRPLAVFRKVGAGGEWLAGGGA